jgi:hypothetical protein
MEALATMMSGAVAVTITSWAAQVTIFSEERMATT